jgi:hypothetical protein
MISGEHRACTEEKTEVYKMLVEEVQKKRQHGRLGHGWKYNIRPIVDLSGIFCDVILSYLVQEKIRLCACVRMKMELV